MLNKAWLLVCYINVRKKWQLKTEEHMDFSSEKKQKSVLDSYILSSTFYQEK